MHTPGQFGPPAIFAFAPLCTKRERSQIGTGNRVRTGELPIRVDQFLAIRAEKLCEALAYFGEDIGAMMALVGSPAPGVSHQIIALPRPCETGAVHIWVPVAVRASTAIFR